MKKSVYIFIFIALIIINCVNIISAFGFPNITEHFNFPGEPITVINFVNESNFSNATNYINSNVGAIGDFNSTQFENNAGTLSIIWSWLTGELDNIYCELTGCNMTGNLNVTGNVTATYFIGDGSGLTNINTSIFNDTYVNIDGDNMTGDLRTQNLTVNNSIRFENETSFITINDLGAIQIWA